MSKRSFQILIFILGFIAPQIVLGQIKLPRLVRDSMILQRDTKINIWGWASKNEKVNIKFNGKSYKTTAGAELGALYKILRKPVCISITSIWLPI